MKQYKVNFKWVNGKSEQQIISAIDEVQAIQKMQKRIGPNEFQPDAGHDFTAKFVGEW